MTASTCGRLEPNAAISHSELPGQLLSSFGAAENWSAKAAQWTDHATLPLTPYLGIYSLSELLDIGEESVVRQSVRALHNRIPDDVFRHKLFLDCGEVDEVSASDFEIATKVRERLANNYCHLVSG